MRGGWKAGIAVLVLAGCMDFVAVPGPTYDGLAVYLSLAADNPGPGAAPDTLRVTGFVSGPGGVRLTHDTLRVGGVAIAPLQHGTSAWRYSDTLVLAPGTLRQPVQVTMPTLEGVRLALQQFDFLSVARGGPDTLTVRAGADVVLPIQPGGAPAEVKYEQWTVTVSRGQGMSEIRTTTRPPASLVIPGSLVPADTASAMTIEMRSSRASAAHPPMMYVTAEAVLRWRVRIVP